tara:strand:- start:798 stop:1364 length:567 start_codon:yes stop_codon:yes gene_type:complete
VNILTIDADYAYSPSISEYDDYVDGSRIELGKQLAVIQALGFDAIENPKKVADVVSCLSRAKLSAPVHVIKHHHRILDFLPETMEFKVFNMDHHHDIYYPGWHDKDVLDEGNWVYHMKGCVEYTWIRNNDSEDMPDHALNFPVNETIFSDELVESLPEFDLVIFCESPHWTGGQGMLTVSQFINELNK